MLMEFSSSLRKAELPSPWLPRRRRTWSPQSKRRRRASTCQPASWKIPGTGIEVTLLNQQTFSQLTSELGISFGEPNLTCCLLHFLSSSIVFNYPWLSSSMVLVMMLQKRDHQSIIHIFLSLGRPDQLLLWFFCGPSYVVFNCPWFSLSLVLIMRFQKKVHSTFLSLGLPALLDHLLLLWSKQPWPCDCPQRSLSMVLIMMFQKRPIVCFCLLGSLTIFFCGQSDLDLPRSPPHPSCVMTEAAKYSPIAALHPCTTLLHYIAALHCCNWIYFRNTVLNYDALH